ncbi:hypothetical protein SteCoe_7344 [Stentor coeruleus]|uniref:Uncharacterized protein n=1 Tax=Stentor coeruleus TaxID=5963 RepID=A0A1R2CMT3_9CILI|nr:hypothetical protein SteCoe_7344 [Stentor coeruleus]
MWILLVFIISSAINTEEKEEICMRVVRDLSQTPEFDIKGNLSKSQKAQGMKAMNYILYDMFQACNERITHDQIKKFSNTHQKITENFLGLTMKKYKDMEFPTAEVDFLRKMMEFSTKKKEL